MSLKNKAILITAGPTWVPIDKVRVISNIASGQTGLLLANQAKKMGADVTLILGPVGEVGLSKKIRVRHFRYFDELHALMRGELKKKKYDVVIHSAAVSDYSPKKKFSRKIKSGIKDFTLEFETTVKIADKIKKYAPKVFLTIFKLELDLSKNEMLSRARDTLRGAKADLAVLNTFSNKCAYKALIIDERKEYCQVYTKEKLSQKLLQLVSSKVNLK
ncbi:phosphopantothenoylcysteine decarboxylase [Candidatus Omnitrophota bacterium]